MYVKKECVCVRERDCQNLNLAENREILNAFVVISNEIDHLMCMLSELLRIHWPQPTLPTLIPKCKKPRPTKQNHQTNITNAISKDPRNEIIKETEIQQMN